MRHAAEKRKKAAEEAAAKRKKQLERQAALDKKYWEQAQSIEERLIKQILVADKKNAALLKRLRESAGLDAQGRPVKSATTADQGLTKADLAGFFRDFLTQFERLQASKATPAGGFAQTAVLEHLMRENNQHLADLRRTRMFVPRPADDAEFA